MNKISQRDAFWSRIYERALADRNIVVVSADMGAPSLDKFRRDLPSQFINVGIAEQNAILIASGLVLTGKKVFTYAIAPFITLRCLEQIRVNSAIMKLPITIVGVGAGFGYEDSGPTHHIIEDISIMRSMPGIIIHSVSDSVIASAFAEISCDLKITNYVRMDRLTLPNLYDSGEDFTQGLAVLKEAKDYYFIATGSMTHLAQEAAGQLKMKGLDIGVIDLYTIPINEEIFIRRVKKTKKLITLEENFLPGGLGSAVCEVLQDNSLLIPVKRIGLPLEKGYCYKYGGRDVIREYYGINIENIKKTAIQFIGAK